MKTLTQAEVRSILKTGEKRGAPGDLARALALSHRRGLYRARSRRIEQSLADKVEAIVAAGCRAGASMASDLVERMERLLESREISLARDEGVVEQLVLAREELDALYRYVSKRTGRDDAAMGKWVMMQAKFDASFLENLDSFVSTEAALRSLKKHSRHRNAWCQRALSRITAHIRDRRRQLQALRPWIARASSEIRAVTAKPPAHVPLGNAKRPYRPRRTARSRTPRRRSVRK